MQRQGMAGTPVQSQWLYESVCPNVHDFSMLLCHFEFKLQKAIQPKYAPP